MEDGSIRWYTREEFAEYYNGSAKSKWRDAGRWLGRAGVPRERHRHPRRYNALLQKAGDTGG
eukprot:gene4650-51653_t